MQALYIRPFERIAVIFGEILGLENLEEGAIKLQKIGIAFDKVCAYFRLLFPNVKCKETVELFYFLLERIEPIFRVSHRP